jgi:hypothetical protein
MNSTFPVNLLGSRQNLKSAEAAGEGYPERSSLPINAIGTAVAALLGSHFPNTNYFALLAPPHQADVWAAGALPWSRHRSSSPSCWPPCWFLCAISPVNGSSSLRLLPDQSYESHDCSIVFCPTIFGPTMFGPTVVSQIVVSPTVASSIIASPTVVRPTIVSLMFSGWMLAGSAREACPPARSTPNQAQPAGHPPWHDGSKQLQAPPLSGGKVRTRLIRSHAAGVSSPGTRLD